MLILILPLFSPSPSIPLHPPPHIHLPPDAAFLDDWVGEDPSDLLHFYPIDWNIAINLRQYEIFLFTNRYNWVDIDGTENSEGLHT